MLQIPHMPDLWNMDGILVSSKDVVGALAKWAVLQSPYSSPDRLEEAISEFLYRWPHRGYCTFNSATLNATIYDTLLMCRLIEGWNVPKIEMPPYAIIDDPRNPDYDFIDLHALARNMTHDIVLEAQVENAQDAYRDRTAAEDVCSTYVETSPQYATFPPTQETDRGSSQAD